MRGNLQLTDRMVSDVSKEHKLGFLNNRARISVEDQEQVQVIVLLYAVSGCVAVTALLILAGAGAWRPWRNKSLPCCGPLGCPGCR